MSAILQIGDRVTYSSKFLKSIGLYTKQGSGTVIKFEDMGGKRLVYLGNIKQPFPDTVLEPNLVKIADLHKELH